MKAKIDITSAYGFDHNWTLVIETPKHKRSFYLGQDCKFCSRVLGMETSYVVKQIGTNVIDKGTKGNKKLAEFICKKLKLDGRNIHRFEAWSFSAQ